MCGTPTQWDAPQMLAVADTLEAHAQERGLQLLNSEQVRLDHAVRICRGEQ